MIQLLLIVAVVFAVIAVAQLLAALAIRERRARRRVRVDQLVRDAITGHPPAAGTPLPLLRALALEQADRVRSPVATPGYRQLRSAASRDLRSRRWIRRAGAIRVLIAVRTPEATLRAGLGDAHPQVRALTCSGVTGTDPAIATDLVGLLGDAVPRVRFAALDTLLRPGTGIAPAIAAALTRAGPGRGPSTGVRHRARHRSTDGPRDDPPGSLTHTAWLIRLLRVAAATDDPRTLAGITPFLSAPQLPGVRAAAVTAAAAAGIDVNVALGYLTDPDPSVRAAAATAAGRRRAVAAAAGLGRALTDVDHDVRRAAGTALNQLGAAGTLVLRAALGGADRYAADTARLALGLGPGSPTGAPARSVPATPPTPPVHRRDNADARSGR